MAAHLCHAPGCKLSVPPRMLCCRPHWAMIPKEDQALVWALYRDGQEISKDPSREYVREVGRILDELGERIEAAKPDPSLF